MIEATSGTSVSRTLRYGMVGGGQGSFIGEVHRKAIGLDGLAEIAAGCFSQNFENTKATGKALGIPEDRLYADYEEMAAKEAKRTDRLPRQGFPCGVREAPDLRAERSPRARGVG